METITQTWNLTEINMPYVVENIKFFANPMDLSLQYWIACVVGVIIGELFYDPIIFWTLRSLRLHKMPSRTPPIMKGLEKFGLMDYLYLTINQAVEAAFLMHLYLFVATNPKILRGFDQMTIANVVPPIYLLFLIDDFIYYFAHRLMHHPIFYPWCHKHHHRQSMPRRGYWDAANENPLEQFIGTGAVMLSLKIYSELPLGLHAAGFAIFFFFYSTFAFLNHTEYDVDLGWLGLGYNVRAHEMHHRFPNCNYAQNVMIWDRLFGTFDEYRVKTAKAE